MAEYVLKEDILKYLEKKSSIEISTNSVIGKDISRAIDVLYYDIGNMPAVDVQPVKQWISCKDRMPEVNEPVLFIFNTESGFKTVMYGWHETIKGLGSGWHQAGVGGARADEEVTHWQPLPEPPKDGDTK